MKKTLSIKVYLGISYALLLIIPLGAIGFIWSRNEYRFISREMQNLMLDRVSLLSGIISHEIEERGEVGLDRTEFPVLNQEDHLVAVFIDRSGSLYELVPGTASQYQKDLLIKLSSKYSDYKYSSATLLQSEGEATSIYAVAPVFDSDNQTLGIVCLLLPIVDLESYITRLHWMLLAATLVVTVLGVGVSILLTNFISRQFTQAKLLAEMVTDGDYDLRIPEGGLTELHDLSHYLNVMAERLQTQSNTRRTLLANVAHELARPLAGLLLGIESLRKGAIQYPDLADDMLVSMGQTIHRLESLIDDITLAAQPEALPIKLNLTSLPVEPFLQGVATRFWSLAESRGLKLEVYVPDGVPPVVADEKRLNQIIGNLLDNAIKFTPRDKTILISSEYDGKSNVCLMIHDGGNGISPGEAEHLFEPFFQGNTGRRIKQGMGLGLAIAQQLAQAQGGNLTLGNHPDGGVLAILTLPAADA